MLLKRPYTEEIITDWNSWTRPKKMEHWKAGRSAMELARAWFTSPVPVVPKEMQELLATHPRTAGIVFSEGYPECITGLPQSGEGRNHDLMLRGHVNNEAAVVCVEAKVDEEFGYTIENHLKQGKASSPKSKVPERIDALLTIAFGANAKPDQLPWSGLRYQLLTGIAGTALQAVKDNAPIAVFVAHEFHTAEANAKHQYLRQKFSLTCMRIGFSQRSCRYHPNN